MRLLLISALAAILVGCSSASQQMHADSGLYQTHHEQFSTVHSKRRVLHRRTITAKKPSAGRKNRNSTGIAESHVAPKMDDASFVRADDKSSVVTTSPTAATKAEIPYDKATKTEIPYDEPRRAEILTLDDESAIKKAKANIAAKMKDPDSVKLEDMKRATRKTSLGKSIDSICGFVSDKDSGPRPFLYLVQKDEAYIGGYTIAASEYRNVCSITALPSH